MANKITLNVQKRDLQGKKPKHLRQEGLLIGNIYGLQDSVAVVAPYQETIKLYGAVGESTVVYLKVDGGKEEAVLIDDVQNDPVNGEALHIAFRRVNLKEKIDAAVSIETVGELAAKNAVALLLHNEVEAEALPADLPEGFEIDLSTLTEVGTEIKFADLNYDKSKVKLLVEDLDAAVLIVNEFKEEPEVVEETTEEASTDSAGTEVQAAE
ncbi:MAG: hypothetical protein LBG64_04525 [Pseudomonadales bacterium]|jgi:large subunit ribosomal protein L25|nr:hypothetical protein [Pseudomonadales bacterium]